MKVIQESGRKGFDRDGESIPIGTVFSGRISSYPSRIFVRAYSEIIDLENPRKTWDRPFTIIHNYIELDAELIVREKV